MNRTAVHVTHEAVQMPHQRQQDFAQPRILYARNSLFDGFRHHGLIFDDHVRFPEWPVTGLYLTKKPARCAGFDFAEFDRLRP